MCGLMRYVIGFVVVLLVAADVSWRLEVRDMDRKTGRTPRPFFGGDYNDA